MKMSIMDALNEVIRLNMNVSKVVEASHKGKIEVSKEEIEIPQSKYHYDFYLYALYTPLYDTTYLIGNDVYQLFIYPVTAGKSYELTNMLLAGRLPQPNIFVVKGFSIATSIPNEKLSKVMMEFRLGQKGYAKMPLSHLPFEFPDNRIIIPPGMYFRIELTNTAGDIQDKLVFFINGWELKAVQ